MKCYESFTRIYIGDSDIDSLVLRSNGTVALLRFAGDGGYRAYECFGGNVKIGAHYEKVFSGEVFLQIYDDYGSTYKSRMPQGYKLVDIYRGGEYGCIIHWHN